MMQFFIFLTLGFLVVLTQSRPSRLLEGQDGETGETEYEGVDDTAADDYLREDQESTMKEGKQKSERHESPLQDPQDQDDLRDVEAAPDERSAQHKDGYITFSETNSDSHKERERHEITDFNTDVEGGYLSKREHSTNCEQVDNVSNGAADEYYARPDKYRMKRPPPSEFYLNGRFGNSDSDYGNSMFKMNPDQIITGKRQNSVAKEANELSGVVTHYYNNMRSRNRDREGEIRNENTLNYDRDRRHVQNVEEKQLTDTTSTPNEKHEVDLTEENSENTFISNIKKLSEQELEELLNSLPEDKKALLKKIMDKREITKKSGAIEENSFLEGGQADTSKIDGYSVDCKTESSLYSDTTEISKQSENEELPSTKTPDSENGSGASGSKSEIVNSTGMKDDGPAIRKDRESSDAKNNENVYSDLEEFAKNDNKREINSEDLKNEKISLEGYNVPDYQLNGKNSNDFAINQEDLSSENEDWYETKTDEAKESNANNELHKREISPKESSASQDCMKSLEDSFPAAKPYDENNLESEMAPLIRVKRTEEDHHVRKRDSPLLSNVQVDIFPDVESEDCENEEKSEFEHYGVFSHTPNFIKNDQEVKLRKDNGETQQQSSQFDKRNFDLPPSELQNSKFDKMSLGSDSDSVFTGIEAVDDKLMYNSGLRGKRTLENVHSNKINSNRSGRTVGPMNVDTVSDNNINVPQYQENEAFGPVSKNFEEDVSRFKRVRQTNQAT